MVYKIHIVNPNSFFYNRGYAGRYIAKYSLVFNEQEVIFKNNNVFVVTKIICKGDNSFFLFMKEISQVDKKQIIKNSFTGYIY